MREQLNLSMTPRPTPKTPTIKPSVELQTVVRQLNPPDDIEAFMGRLGSALGVEG